MRALIRSTAFARAAKRLLKKRPDAADDIRAALELLSEDFLHPKLKAHKLKGELEGSWAVSAGYDLRIVFEFVADCWNPRRSVLIYRGNR